MALSAAAGKTFEDVIRGFDSDRHGVTLVADETHISSGRQFSSHLSLPAYIFFPSHIKTENGGFALIILFSVAKKGDPSGFKKNSNYSLEFGSFDSWKTIYTI